MKKIGIITLFTNNNNYGGVAQAYALWKYITKKGYSCELINYKKQKNEKKTIIGICKKNIKKIIMMPNNIYVLLKSIKYKNNLKKREEKLEEFRNRIPHSEEFSLKTIEKIKGKYDIYVTGSDQCWNPYVVDDAFVYSFLDNKEKVISYATSIAIENVDEIYEKYMKKHLKKYKNISVREKSSKKIIEKIGYDCELVVDPTLLLSRDDWEDITSPRLIDSKYVVAYILGNSTEQRKKIIDYAKELNMKLITIPFIKNGNQFKFKIEDDNFGDNQMIDISFEDFLSLIKYSELVITDSFHAVCFSYIYKKNFYVFERTGVSTSSRIRTIMNEMNISEERIIKNNINKETPIDYEKVDESIKPIIKNSQKILDVWLK